MTIDPGVVTAIFAGLAALLTAAGGISASRARKAGITRRDYRRMERRFIIALAHVFRLESALAGAGCPVPSRPTGLGDDEDEDDPPALAPAAGGPYADG